MNEPRAAAVVGAGGFIGAALVRGLEDLQIPVTGFTRSTPLFDEAGRLAGGAAKADTVYWLASSIRPATASSNNADVAADRIALTSLLDGLRAEGLDETRLVVVSSGGTVYDPTCPVPHTESSRLAPANEYGAAMLSIEELVRSQSSDPVVLRVANAYGPGQPPRRGQGVIAYWLAAIAAGEPIRVLGAEHVARDYVYIGDVVDALVRVHTAVTPPPIVNIGSGVPTTLGELVELVTQTVAPQQVAVHHDAGRSFDAPSTWLDISLAAAELGWQPTTALAEGLAQTWLYTRLAASSST